MPYKRSSRDVPDFPIGTILEHLGADSVPTGLGWVRCKCPFHEDRTASASVNYERNAFRCHGCDVHGDALKLLQMQLGLDFKEALELAKQLTGIEATDSKPLKKRRPSELLGGT